MTSTPLYPFTPPPPPPSPKKNKNENQKPQKTKEIKKTYALFTRLVDKSDVNRVHCLGAFPSSKDPGRRGRMKNRLQVLLAVQYCRHIYFVYVLKGISLKNSCQGCNRSPIIISENNKCELINLIRRYRPEMK